MNAVTEAAVSSQPKTESPVAKRASTKRGTTAKAKRPSKAKITKVSKEKKGKAKKEKSPRAKSQLDLTSKVKKLVKENPRHEGSNRYKRFAAYRDGMTVEALLKDKRVTRAGIHQDIEDKLIKLS